MHVTIFLFEVHDTTWFSMVGQLQALLQKFDLMQHVFAFVKDENSNLISMASTLCSIGRLSCFETLISF
jgi:hypothetical protein